MFDAVALSFIFFLALFAAVGAWSVRRRQATTDDYLLAGRSMGPWLTALSAVATNNSGFMFIGLIGAAYTQGLSAMWIMVGWVFGDYLMWFWIHPRLRRLSEQERARTVPSFLGADLGGPERHIRGVAAVIVVVFLGSYAAAQLNAGSKALHVLFGWDYAAGAVLGAGIVLLYCFAGGIRASIWTDAAQSTVMIAAILLLCVVSLDSLGGFGGLWDRLAAIDPQLIDPVPPNPRFGFPLFVLGWFGAGIGVIGQPHIMVRAMAARNWRDLLRARHIYVVWYVVFSAGCILAALACRALLPDVGRFDAELALPALAETMLPPVLVGLVLAGLFAATMSTADSQLLSCSAALTQDLFVNWRESYAAAKAATVVVTLGVLAIALEADQNVFELVAMSWSSLAAGLGPLMAVRASGRVVSAPLSIAMMLAGVATVFIWSRALGWSDHVFEALPGIVVGAATYWIGRCLGALSGAEPVETASEERVVDWAEGDRTDV